MTEPGAGEREEGNESQSFGERGKELVAKAKGKAQPTPLTGAIVGLLVALLFLGKRRRKRRREVPTDRLAVLVAEILAARKAQRRRRRLAALTGGGSTRRPTRRERNVERRRWRRRAPRTRATDMEVVEEVVEDETIDVHDDPDAADG